MEGGSFQPVGLARPVLGRRLRVTEFSCSQGSGHSAHAESCPLSYVFMGRRLYQKFKALMSSPPLSPTHPSHPRLSLTSSGGSESTPDAVTVFEIWKWVTWCKRKLMRVEDNKLAGTSRNPCWLTSCKSSRVLILKEIPKKLILGWRYGFQELGQTFFEVLID